MLTCNQAAARLNVSARRIRQYIAAGTLPASKHGRDWLINPLDVARFTRRLPGRPKEGTQ
jgi:excisionase family DNA binding protein